MDAVKEAVGAETEIVYEQNPSIETIEGETDDISYAIVAVGEGPYAKCGGDNSELVIHFNGGDIISLVSERVPTLVILVCGRPLVLEPWVLEKVEGVVVAWLPGSEGQGITDVVFGDYDFKGQLPVTWFTKVEHLDDQLPKEEEEDDEDGVISFDSLFPLGFGLTYRHGNL